MYSFLSLHVLTAFLSIVYPELGSSKQANAVLNKIFITYIGYNARAIIFSLHFSSLLKMNINQH